MTPAPRLFLPLLAAGFGLATGAVPTVAQDSPLVLELAGGYVEPLGSFADGTGPGEGATGAPSLSVSFLLPGAGRRGLYVGFSQHRFGCEASGCPSDERLVATGFDLGLRFAFWRDRPVIPWIRLGAITTRVETDPLGGGDAGVSRLGLGGEIGFGLYVDTGTPVGLDPSVRYGRVSTELPGGADLAVRYWLAQLALGLAF